MVSTVNKHYQWSRFSLGGMFHATVMHASCYQETPASSSYKSQRRNRTRGRKEENKRRGETRQGGEEDKHCNISLVSFSSSLETPLVPWATSSTAIAKEGKHAKKRKKNCRPARISSQAATTSTSTKPLQRDKNIVYRENEKNKGRRKHTEVEERRRRTNVCHHNRLPLRQRHREPPAPWTTAPPFQVILFPLFYFYAYGQALKNKRKKSYCIFI